MKILQVIPYFTPKRGGDVNVCYNISKQLVKHNHKVTIITTDFEFDEGFAKSIENSGLKVKPFHCVADIGLFLFSPSMNKWLKNNISAFDIIHTHGFRSYQNIVVHYYAKKFNIPYILHTHGDIPHMNIKQKRKKIFDIFFGHKIIDDASKIFALTKREKENCKNIGAIENKIEIMPNGIDVSEYNNLPEKSKFRNKYSMPEDRKVILYIGRLHKTKGIELLIEAFADLAKKSDNVRLVLVGHDDGYRSALENHIRELKVDDKVLFVGFISNFEKMTAFVDADIFVSPSFSGFPVTFLEACACGTPIITTHKGDELDWIHDKVGYVVEYDKNQLRDAISRILNDNELRMRFSEEGKILVKKIFDWDKMIMKIERNYICTMNTYHVRYNV